MIDYLFGVGFLTFHLNARVVKNVDIVVGMTLWFFCEANEVLGNVLHIC